MRRTTGAALALLGAVVLAGCGGDEPGASGAPSDTATSPDAPAPTAAGEGAARPDGEPAVADPGALRGGVRAAPGTRLLGEVGTTAGGWYAALDLDGATPAEVARFYRDHLADLGLAVADDTAPLTVVATSPGAEAGAGAGVREVRVDVVPTSGDVPAFARVVARG